MIRLCDPIFDYLEEKVKILSSKKKVIDIGTSRRFNKEISYCEHYFSDNYMAMGYMGNRERIGDWVDYFGDVEKLPFEDEYCDGLICLSVLEHMRNPS